MLLLPPPLPALLPPFASAVAAVAPAYIRGGNMIQRLGYFGLPSLPSNSCTQGHHAPHSRGPGSNGGVLVGGYCVMCQQATTSTLAEAPRVKRGPAHAIAAVPVPAELRAQPPTPAAALSPGLVVYLYVEAIGKQDGSGCSAAGWLPRPTRYSQVLVVYVQATYVWTSDRRLTLGSLLCLPCVHKPPIPTAA